MSTIRKFEDLVIWQKARELNKIIYQYTSNATFNRDFELRSQIRKSSISISSNIAEGFERSGNREFKQFLSIAKGSAGELRSQLYLSVDLNYINTPEFELAFSKSSEISKMINGFIQYLNKSPFKGLKQKSKTS